MGREVGFDIDAMIEESDLLDEFDEDEDDDE